MVGHQHVGMDRTAEIRSQLGQVVEIERVVLVGEEAGLAVVAALDQMQRYAGERDAGAARHARLVRVSPLWRTALWRSAPRTESGCAALRVASLRWGTASVPTGPVLAKMTSLPCIRGVAPPKPSNRIAARAIIRCNR